MEPQNAAKDQWIGLFRRKYGDFIEFQFVSKKIAKNCKNNCEGPEKVFCKKSENRIQGFVSRIEHSSYTIRSFLKKVNTNITVANK